MPGDSGESATPYVPSAAFLTVVCTYTGRTGSVTSRTITSGWVKPETKIDALPAAGHSIRFS
jgi:hypothetical protein